MGGLFSRSNPPPPQRTQPAAPSRSTNRPPPTSHSNPQTRPPRQQPTANDVASYVPELLDLSSYLDGLDSLISGDAKVAGEVLDLDDETMTNYLEALSIKADYLNGIRKFLDSHPNVAEADLLRGLLDDVEPKCRQMRATLSRLRSSLIVEGSVKRRSEAQSSSGSNDQPGPSRLSGPTPVVAPSGSCQPSPSGSNQPVPSGSNQPSPSGSNQPNPTGSNQPNPAGSNQRSAAGSNRGGQSPISPVARVPVLSQSRDLVPSNSSEDEDSESDEERDRGHRRLSANIRKVEEWRTENSTPNPKSIKIDRSNNLLDQVIPWYANAKSKTLRRISNVTFAGERGTDMGALTREFFFIAFEAVISGMFKSDRLLEGERGHLIPNAMADCRAFTYLGRMIVHAIINDCKGLSGLSPAIVHILVNGKSMTKLEDSHPPLHIDDVADPQLKQLLQKYDNREDFDALEEDAWMNWMTESNCQANWRSPDARQYVIQQILLHYVFMKRMRQINALEEGLKELGLLRLLINNATKENISEVFPSDDSTAYSPDTIEAIVVTRGDIFDLTTFDLFKQFMQDLHKGNIADYRLCDLIQYVTSSPYLPERLVVSFSPDITIPEAHACYNEITLPLAHQTYPEFKTAMVTAFLNGLTGFQLQ